jgi:hypothetical protein
MTNSRTIARARFNCVVVGNSLRPSRLLGSWIQLRCADQLGHEFFVNVGIGFFKRIAQQLRPFGDYRDDFNMEDADRFRLHLNGKTIKARRRHLVIEEGTPDERYVWDTYALEIIHDLP